MQDQYTSMRLVWCFRHTDSISLQSNVVELFYLPTVIASHDCNDWDFSWEIFLSFETPQQIVPSWYLSSKWNPFIFWAQIIDIGLSCNSTLPCCLSTVEKSYNTFTKLLAQSLLSSVYKGPLIWTHTHFSLVSSCLQWKRWSSCEMQWQTFISMLWAVHTGLYSREKPIQIVLKILTFDETVISYNSI